MRDARRSAVRHTNHLMGEYSHYLNQYLYESKSVRSSSEFQIAALHAEEQRVKDKGAQTTREYANYLVGMRRLDEDASAMDAYQRADARVRESRKK